jgi:hypothetical protein
MDFENSAAEINPGEIASILVLKAANGAIIITNKSGNYATV